MVSKLDSNQQMFIFSTSNIRKEEDRRFWVLRLEGFILRIRYVLYQAILVALCQNPTLVSLIILTIELVHLSVFLYYSARYRYAKNWLLTISKFNVGLTIIYFSFLAFILSVKQDSSSLMSRVAAFVQGFALTVAINCLVVETILILVNLSTTVYEAYVNFRNGKRTKKLVTPFWMKSEVFRAPSAVFDDLNEEKRLMSPRKESKGSLNKVFVNDQTTNKKEIKGGRVSIG